MFPVVIVFFLLIKGSFGSLLVSSSLNPALSGVYVRGVELGHELAFAQVGNSDLWLFKRDNGIDGFRWFIGPDVSSHFVLAFWDTWWSSDPCNIGGLDSTNPWMVTREQEWHPDPTFRLTCQGLEEGGVDSCSLGVGGEQQQQQRVPCISLAGGVEMPLVMLGTAHISASHGAGAANPETIEAPPAIEAAIDLGYQGLDLGSQAHPAYANEAAVGDLLAKRPGRRRSLFLTTKLSPNEHGFNATLRAFQRSLRLLGTDTIDLYLIHHPQCLMADHCEGDWQESWRALERLLGMGAVRAIGVSNFDAPLLTRLLLSPKIARAPVALLQNRADPLAPEDPEVLKLCQSHGINYQAFSVLGRQWVVGPWSTYWHQRHPILAHPQVQAISDRLSEEIDSGYNTTASTTTNTNNKSGKERVSPAQVVLRWALEKGWSVVPKTANIARLDSNRRLFHFTLTENDIHTLDNLPPPASETEL